MRQLMVFYCHGRCCGPTVKHPQHRPSQPSMLQPVQTRIIKSCSWHGVGLYSTGSRVEGSCASFAVKWGRQEPLGAAPVVVDDGEVPHVACQDSTLEGGGGDFILSLPNRANHCGDAVASHSICTERVLSLEAAQVRQQQRQC
jgi:hypothetical protein